MKTLLKTLLYTLIIMFTSQTMAAASGSADQAAPCIEGITQHHAGPPGKGVDRFVRNDCNRAEIAAFERSTTVMAKTASNGGHENMTGQPGNSRLPKH